jgi:hypothetical protein
MESIAIQSFAANELRCNGKSWLPPKPTTTLKSPIPWQQSIVQLCHAYSHESSGQCDQYNRTRCGRRRPFRIVDDQCPQTAHTPVSKYTLQVSARLLVAFTIPPRVLAKRKHRTLSQSSSTTVPVVVHLPAELQCIHNLSKSAQTALPNIRCFTSSTAFDGRLFRGVYHSRAHVHATFEATGLRCENWRDGQG